MSATPSRRRLLGATLCLLAASPALRAQTAAPDLACIRRGLEAGNLVLAFRHGRTDRGGVDRVHWPRERQRLLSPAGEAQARAVGAAFRRHRWLVGAVTASPFHRCMDFARIAFGRAEADPRLLGLLSADEGRAAREAHTRRIVRDPVPAGGNLIAVTHTSNLAAALDLTLAEGAAAVLRPTGAGYDLLGVMSAPEDWDAI